MISRPNIESNLTGVSIHIKCGIIFQEPILKLSSTIASVLIVKQKTRNYMKTIQSAKDFFSLLQVVEFQVLLRWRRINSHFVAKFEIPPPELISYANRSANGSLDLFTFRTHPQISYRFFYCISEKYSSKLEFYAMTFFSRSFYRLLPG